MSSSLPTTTGNIPGPSTATGTNASENAWFLNDELLDLYDENLTMWKLAFEDIVSARNAEYLLSSQFRPATPEQSKAAATCRLMIFKSLSKDISKRLAGSNINTKNILTLVQAIQTIIPQKTVTDPFSLLQKAQDIRLKDSMDVYIQEHLDARAEQVAANCPGSHNEKYTVYQIVQGLRFHPRYAQLAYTLQVTQLPNTVSELRSKINAHEATTGPYTDQTNFTSSIATTRYPTQSFNPTHRTNTYANSKYRGRGRGRGRGRFGRQPLHKVIESMNAKINTLEGQLHKTKKASARASTTQQEKEKDFPLNFEPNDHEGRYLLDSGAHPSIVKHPLKDEHALTSPKPTQTASHVLQTKKAGQLDVTLNNNQTVSMPALRNDALSANLVSVRELAAQCGSVFFTKNKAIIGKHITKPQYNNRPATATWRGDAYVLDQNKSHTRSNSQATALNINHINKQVTPSELSQSALNRYPDTTPHSQTSRPINEAPTNIIRPRKRPKHNTVTKSSNKPNSSASSKPYAAATFMEKAPTQQSDAAFHHWHLVLNHINMRTIQKMAKKSVLPLPEQLQAPPPKISCSGCLQGKLKRSPHPPTKQNVQPGEVIFSDFCGPFSPTSINGNRYFLTMLDTASKFAIVVCTKTREAPIQFLTYVFEWIRNKFGRYPTRWVTDNAKEFLAQAVQTTCSQRGIAHETIVPHSPQSNSHAEKLNDNLVSTTRSILAHSKMPQEYWDMAILDATYKYNHILHSTTNSTPAAKWDKQAKVPQQLFIWATRSSLCTI